MKPIPVVVRAQFIGKPTSWYCADGKLYVDGRNRLIILESGSYYGASGGISNFFHWSIINTDGSRTNNVNTSNYGGPKGLREYHGAPVLVQSFGHSPTS